MDQEHPTHDLSEAMFRTAIETMLDAFGIYSAIRDVRGRIVDFRVEYVNDAACASNRMTRDAQIDRELCVIIPAIRESGLFDAYCRVVETGKPLAREAVIYSDVPGNETITRAFELRAGKWSDGFVVTWREITDRKRAELEHARLLAREQHARRAAEQATARYKALVDTSAQIVWRTTADGIPVDVAGMTQIPYDAVPRLGANWIECVHPDDREATERSWRAAVASGNPYAHELRLRFHDGPYRSFHARGNPIRAGDGSISEWVGTLVDVTEERRRETANRLLADAGTLLGSDFDVFARLQALARVLVPILGDWCVVDLIDAEGTLEAMAAHHRDPTQECLVRELFLHFRPHPLGAQDHDAAATRGWPTLVHEVTNSLLEAIARNQDHLRLLRTVAASTWLTVPLAAQGRTLGALTVARTTPDQPYDEQDLALAEELARRAALALENARLYNEAQLARAGAERVARRISNLQRITAALSEVSSVSDIAGVVVNQTLHAINAQFGTIILRSDDGESFEWTPATGYQFDPDDPWQTLPVTARLPVAEAARSGTPIFVETDVTHDPRFAELALCPVPSPIVAAAAVSLQRDDQSFGAIGFLFTTARQFSAEDRTFLQTVARLCAQALERVRLYDAEQQARTRAEAAVLVRDQFLSVAAHELKGPMTIMLGSAQLLERRARTEGNFSERNERVVRMIDAQARRLNSMIADLLDVSRIEQGQLRIHPRPLDVSTVVARVIGEMRATLTSHAIVADGLDVAHQVNGDEERLAQVFRNLLGNAVKYSPHRNTVTVTAERREQTVCVAISDRGIGMPPDVIPRLFQRFYRASNAERYGIAGTGIGLYVVNEVVRLHGGTIKVESVESEGSTFTVTLPIVDCRL